LFHKKGKGGGQAFGIQPEKAFETYAGLFLEAQAYVGGEGVSGTNLHEEVSLKAFLSALPIQGQMDGKVGKAHKGEEFSAGLLKPGLKVEIFPFREKVGFQVKVQRRPLEGFDFQSGSKAFPVGAGAALKA
jgi:hypothetical protein